MEKITTQALAALAVALTPAGVAAHGGHSAPHGTLWATLSHLGITHVFVAVAVLAVAAAAVAASGRSRPRF